MNIYDLLYMENQTDYDEIRTALTTQYPEARIEDASDYIHTHRLSCEMERDEDEYLEFLFRSGIAPVSFTVQMMRYDDPKRLIAAIEKINASESQS